MRMTKPIAASALAVAFCSLTTTEAVAAPSRAPSSTSQVTFYCGPAGVFTGFANSGNSQALTWNPFFLTDSHGATLLLVPTANDLVVTYDGNVVFAPNATKGGAPGAVTCDVSGGGGAVVVGGSVTGILVSP